MYTDYFGFNENPFSIAPNPRYLYMSTMHQEALGIGKDPQMLKVMFL